MKTIETLAMDEEMALSPNGVNPDSPRKAEDAAIVGSESSDDEFGLKDEILTNDSLEEALDKQLASLEEEEEEEETETVPERAEEVTETAEETVATITEAETESAKETVSDETEMDTDKTAEVEQTDTCDTEKMGEKTDTTSDSEEKSDDLLDNERQKDSTVNTGELKADSKGKLLIFNLNIFRKRSVIFF